MTGHCPVVNDSDFAHPSPQADRERPLLGGGVHTAGVSGDVEPGFTPAL